MVQLNTREKEISNFTIDSIVGESLTVEEQLIFGFNRYVSRCIISQRKKLNMTQEELARRSGVSRVTISAIEKRKRIVSTEILLKLLHTLNLSVSFVEQG